MYSIAFSSIVQTAEGAQTQYDLTTLDVAQLQQDFDTLMSYGDEVQQESAALLANATEALTNIVATGNDILSMPAIDVDVDALLQEGRSLSAEADDLEAKVGALRYNVIRGSVWYSMLWYDTLQYDVV